MKLERIHPGQPLASAILSETVTKLSAVEAIAYLRIVAMSEHHARIYPSNASIHKDTEATKNAIRKLETLGLIRVRRGARVRKLSHVGREIEVLR